jgi:hypothetical protein
VEERDRYAIFIASVPYMRLIAKCFKHSKLLKYKTIEIAIMSMS